MSRDPHDVPFHELLATKINDGNTAVQTGCPDYAAGAGFAFDLSCLTTNQHQLDLSPHKAFSLKALEDRTSLDPAQAESLKYALTHQIALIQGPPGTGKSFTGVAIIKVLVHNARKAGLGPLLCVTYTNHALDQILEHCVDAGIEKIIRVGSRSQSEVLEKCNLREVVMQAEKTWMQKRDYYQARKAAERTSSLLNGFFLEFVAAWSTASVRRHLETQHPDHYKQLFVFENVDDQGFRVFRARANDPLQSWIIGGSIGPQTERRPIKELQGLPIFELNRAERRSLYSYWVSAIRQQTSEKIATTLGEYQNAKRAVDTVRQDQELRCLRGANIIGMTTSGLARIIDQLKYLDSKVILMEEAGEVLEVSAFEVLES